MKQFRVALVDSTVNLPAELRTWRYPAGTVDRLFRSRSQFSWEWLGR